MKFIKKASQIFLSGFILLLILLFSANSSLACSCRRSPTVDIEFDKSPTVAVLKLGSVEKFAEGEEGYGYGGIKQSKLIVEKVFKGNLKVGQELTFAQGGGGDCVWTFSEEGIGTEFLLYLGEKPKNNIWTAGTCSRSTSLKNATQDLLYIKKVAELRGKTRLSGRLAQNIRASVKGQESSFNLLAGKKVIITGNEQNIELKTDENGVYEIYDLPSGNYQITPERINGYKNFRGERLDSFGVEIKAKTHTEQNLNYIIDNRIRGKFFDTDGKPLKDVCLKLLPARGEKPDYFYESDCTDANGKFEIEEIPAGTYVIVINDDGEITGDEPFGTFYYPNTTKREEASEITIGAGDYFDNLNITAQLVAETVTVSGVLMFEDNKPIKNKTVYFTVENEVANSAETDSKGNFSMNVLKGQKGKLSASMWSYIGEFENCPKLDKIIRFTGQDVPLIETQPVEIEANTDLIGIEIKFPFPSCKKSKVK